MTRFNRRHNSADLFEIDLELYGPQLLEPRAGLGPIRLAELAAHGIRAESDRLGMSLRELQRIPGLGRILAQRLVALRDLA
jgi:hypothetical protein